MADFCKQCSLDMFGRDFGDLKDIVLRNLTKKEIANNVGWWALCEGCGPIIVNDEGECIAGKCLKKHREIKS